jgi:DNA polymerase-1
MQRRGIGFDVGRAAEFAKYLRDVEAQSSLDCERAIGHPLKRAKHGGIEASALRAAFFDELGVPVTYVSESGSAALDVNALQAYATSHDVALSSLAKAELTRRRAVKIRSTYCDALIDLERATPGRIHPSWSCTGTVSGRWGVSNPNLANLPRKENDLTVPLGGIRSLYVAPPGKMFSYFDYSQIEFRVAAYASNDAAMIATCEGGDVHGGNAQAIFGEAFDPGEYKRLKKSGEDPERFAILDALRTLAKSSVFAICYMAEATTVYERVLASGVKTTLARITAVLNSLQRRYRVYYAWSDENLREAVRTGIVRSPILGRERFVGHSPGAPEVANFPIQSGAADLVNPVLWKLHNELPHRAGIVAHVYDSVLIEHDVAQKDAVEETVKRIACATQRIGEREFVLPIDFKVLERWE